MSNLINAIIAACYSVLALATALLLPEVLPQLSQPYGAVAGAGVLVGGLVVQFFLILRARGRQFAYQLEDIRRQTQRLAEDLLDTQTQSLHWLSLIHI